MTKWVVKRRKSFARRGHCRGREEGGSIIHRCRARAHGVWARGCGSPVDEGERDRRVRKARIHPFECCFKLIIKNEPDNFSGFLRSF